MHVENLIAINFHAKSLGCLFMASTNHIQYSIQNYISYRIQFINFRALNIQRKEQLNSLK